MSLHAEKSALVKERMISEASKGLAQTQAESLLLLQKELSLILRNLLQKKLTTVKESYFPKEEVQLKEDIATDVAKTIDDPRMAAYVRAINAQR